MGHNEYSPVKKTGHSASIFGTTRMGATVIDALDTLLIMNMTAEAARARDWVASNLNFDVVKKKRRNCCRWLYFEVAYS